jgi:hypothetical protein
MHLHSQGTLLGKVFFNIKKVFVLIPFDHMQFEKVGKRWH